MGPGALESRSNRLCNLSLPCCWPLVQDGNGLSLKEMDAGLEVKDMVDAEAEKTFAKTSNLRSSGISWHL